MTIRIHQAKYMLELLDRFGMADCNPTAVPSIGDDPRESASLEDPVTYRSLRDLTFGGKRDLELRGFSGANYPTTYPSQCKSTSGYVFFMCGAAINRLSNLHALVALSIAESEYIALCVTVQEAAFLRQMRMELGFPQDGTATPIGVDNQACITIATTDMTSARTKHLDIRLHFVRDAHRDGRVNIFYVPTDDMLAHMFTKPL
eukprot:jgi/Tetstr1/436375/TSEL_025208.t1